MFKVYREVNFVISVGTPGAQSRFELLEAIRKVVLKQQK